MAGKLTMWVLCISRKLFTNYLSNLDYVIHTIILEKTRFTENNKVGRYQNPISISLGAYFIFTRRC